MAKATITQVTDDIDGTPDAQPVSFALHGMSYSIDLAAKNLDRLNKALAPFIERATKQRGVAATTRGGKATTKPVRRYDIVQLREWAGKNKIEVPSRGRIPGAVVDRYLAAGGH